MTLLLEGNKLVELAEDIGIGAGFVAIFVGSVVVAFLGAAFFVQKYLGKDKNKDQ